MSTWPDELGSNGWLRRGVYPRGDESSPDWTLCIISNTGPSSESHRSRYRLELLQDNARALVITMGTGKRVTIRFADGYRPIFVRIDSFDASLLTRVPLVE